MNSDIGQNHLLLNNHNNNNNNHNNNNHHSRTTDDDDDPRSSLLVPVDLQQTQSSSKEGGWPTSSKNNNHVFLNDSFDFVLPNPTPIVTNGEPVEGTLIDLVDAEDAVTSVNSRSPVKNRSENNHTSPVGQLIDTGPDRDSATREAVAYNRPHSLDEGHSDGDEDILCMYEKQHLLASHDQNGHPQHHQEDAMDRESEPLIAYGRGRLGSTDITVSVPGKPSLFVCGFAFGLGHCDCDETENEMSIIQCVHTIYPVVAFTYKHPLIGPTKQPSTVLCWA